MIKRVFNLPPLMFVGGETEHLKFFLKTESGGIFDADGCDASFAIIQYTNHGGTAVLTKNAVISADVSGMKCFATVPLESADTVDLCGRYIYQISITNDEGITEIPGQGVIDIVHNIDPALI